MLLRGKGFNDGNSLYGLDVEEHGGGCCGIQHLYAFPKCEATDKERQEWLRRGVEACLDQYDFCDDGDTCDCHTDEDGDPYDCGRSGREGWNLAIEVVLASFQIDEWAKPLTDFGFKEVFSFHNSNSGNRCHVFFYEVNGK